MAIHPTAINRRQTLQWDVKTWSKALDLWEAEVLHLLPGAAYGLEIGAWNGGLTAYFAQRDYRMVCSDIEPVRAEAKALHQQFAPEADIHYATFSACEIPYPDGAFDFVVFKSVLGAVGRNGQFSKQQQAVQEMYRVLKPGGFLLFAENLQGSRLHRWARKKYMPWGTSWRYVSLHEINALLASFSTVRLCSTGFLAAFIPRPEWLKNLAATLDRLPFPAAWRYVAFGYARKPVPSPTSVKT